MYSKPVYLRWSRSEPEDIGVVIEFGGIDTLFGWIDAFLLLTMASLSRLESSRMLRPLLRLFESRSSRCFGGFSTNMSSEKEKLYMNFYREKKKIIAWKSFKGQKIPKLLSKLLWVTEYFFLYQNRKVNNHHRVGTRVISVRRQIIVKDLWKFSFEIL